MSPNCVNPTSDTSPCSLCPRVMTPEESDARADLVSTRIGMLRKIDSIVRDPRMEPWQLAVLIVHALSILESALKHKDIIPDLVEADRGNIGLGPK